MNDYGKRARRTMNVMKDVKDTLGEEEGHAWIRRNMDLAKRSTTAYEEAWEEDKQIILGIDAIG